MKSEPIVDPALAALRDLPQKYIGGWHSSGCYDSSCNMGWHSGYCRKMKAWVRKHSLVLRVAEALREADSADA